MQVSPSLPGSVDFLAERSVPLSRASFQRGRGSGCGIPSRAWLVVQISETERIFVRTPHLNPLPANMRGEGSSNRLPDKLHEKRENRHSQRLRA